jgi:hypothetical protein
MKKIEPPDSKRSPYPFSPSSFYPSGTFYESQLLSDIVRGYGLETVKLERFSAAAPNATFDYPLVGEFWMMEPEKRPGPSISSVSGSSGKSGRSGRSTRSRPGGCRPDGRRRLSRRAERGGVCRYQKITRRIVVLGVVFLVD